MPVYGKQNLPDSLTNYIRYSKLNTEIKSTNVTFVTTGQPTGVRAYGYFRSTTEDKPQKLVKYRNHGRILETDVIDCHCEE